MQARDGTGSSEVRKIWGWARQGLVVSGGTPILGYNAAQMLEAGARVLHERYALTEQLTRGSFGEVYAATDLTTGRAVVLKMLKRRGDAARRRFDQEAEILGRLAGRCAPALIESFELDGKRVLAIERLAGETLDDRLRRRRVLAFAEVAWIVRDVLAALVIAHAEGIVHRDLKPTNVFLETDGKNERARLLDFGVSKLELDDDDDPGPGLTSASATVGTAAYMAPEQYRGSANVDGRADVYAVGALSFELLTGRLAHATRSAELMLWQKLEVDPPSLADATGCAWPDALEAFVRCALARDRTARFGSAIGALEAWSAIVERKAPTPDSALLIGRLAQVSSSGHEATETDD